MNTILIHCIFATLSVSACEQLGVAIQPVADLIGHPYNEKNILMPIPVAGSASVCPRIHQLLYNETVEIVNQTDHAYQIRLSNLFYRTEENKKKHTTYWTEKKNILPVEQIQASLAIEHIIPRTIDYREKQHEPLNTVTLSKPWYCSSFGCTFSAGTRFVTLKQKKRGYYYVYALHPNTYKVEILSIPSRFCIVPARDKEIALVIYNQLLHAWAHAPGFIPYVWGGCSYSYTLAKNTPFCKTAKNAETMYTFPCDDNRTEKCGFDCAGLITRAAQAAGMPYYFKNTTTLAYYLKPVAKPENLIPGDLIWISGHVMAVAHIKKGTIIEARHYSQGYGKIHEIALNKVFKGIKTFNDLFKARENNTTLERLDSRGNIVQKISNYKILSIESCWDFTVSKDM